MKAEQTQNLAVVGTGAGVVGGVAGLILPGFSAATGFVVFAIIAVVIVLLRRA